MNVRSFIFVAGLAFLMLAAQAPSGEVVQPLHILLHENFEDGLAGRWKVVKLGEDEGTGSVRIESGSDGTHFIRVSSVGSFYGLGSDEQFDPASYSEMSWRWRVAKFPDNADIKRKSGDDAAARLYVVFDDRSLFHPFATSALVYVWDKQYPVGGIIPNPYAPEQEKAIVLESGGSEPDQWRLEQVNLTLDYERAFHRRPGPVKGIVFASDSDNTHSVSASDLTDLTISDGARDAALGR